MPVKLHKIATNTLKNNILIPLPNLQKSALK